MKKICNYPEIAAQLHPTKNGNNIEKISIGTNKSYWWVCEKGHEYKGQVRNRIAGHKCPYCINVIACEDNCLHYLHPNIAAEWHPVRNGKITPHHVVAGTNKKCWWKCKKGHEYQSRVRGRIRGRGCPYCACMAVCEDNCLSYVYPEIAAEWHPVRNGKITPRDVVARTSKKYWWLCDKKHEYESSCANRVRQKECCPYCTNRKLSWDNCLAFLFPEIAAEWHPVRNGKITPHDIVATINRKYWWICERGHEYETLCYSRTGKNTGCPICSKSKGESKIASWLKKNGYSFKPQTTFETCRDSKPLLFDFMVGETLIEYHGKQHYFPTGFGSKNINNVNKKFISSVKRDQIKERWCQTNGVSFLVVPYWDIDRIGVILGDFIKGNTPQISEPPGVVKRYESITNKIRGYYEEHC